MTALVHICVQAQLNDMIWIQMEAALILSDLRKIFCDVLSFFGAYSSIGKVFLQPLGVAGDSVEYKWAEADGSVTSMSPTGSKVCFCLGMFQRCFFCRSFFGRPRIFSQAAKSLITAGSRLVPAPKK